MAYEEVSIGEYMLAAEWPRFTKRKTKIWGIYSSKNDSQLGTVAWYSGWRQYAFNPTSDTTFNSGCLESMAEFLKDVNDNHRKKQKKT